MMKLKKQTKNYYCHVALLLFILSLVGCTGGTNKEAKTDPSENDSAKQSQEVTKGTQESDPSGKQEDKSVHKKGSEVSAKDDSNDATSEESKNKESKNLSKNEKENPLSDYSSKKIEYARVWLQLGPNQDLDELNVRHISAGEIINQNDDTSASYPEDVIQLAGSRLVDGSVTYSSNGDGTINVYNVPLRWDSPADVDKNFMQEYTQGIIKNRKLVHVDPGDNEEIIKLIDIMKVH